MTSIAEVLTPHFAEAQSEMKAPQFAWAVSIDGRKVAGVDEKRPFRIASMTKSFVAASVLLMRDRGGVRLDDPITDHVPETSAIRLPTDDSPVITVRHLLTMASGMATDDPWADRLLDLDEAAMDDVLGSGAHFADAPGSKFLYSNLGYAILSRLVTNVSGRPFHDFIDTELLQPLDMDDTTWVTDPDGRAEPHRVQDGVVTDEGLPPLDKGAFSGMSGLWSTADDILKWAHFFLDAYPARDDVDNGPLLRASRREMQQAANGWGPWTIAHARSEEPFGGYGMGLVDAWSPTAGRAVSHSGGLPGYGSHMVWYPERGLAVVALGNVFYAKAHEACLAAVEKLHQAALLPPVKPKPTDTLQPHADALIELLNDWNDEKADELFSFNVSLDEPYDRRRSELTDLPFTAESLSAVNAAYGRLQVKGASGKAYVISFTLSALNPPRVQGYIVKPIPED